MSDKEARKYFENMPYGDDAKSSEIHGKHNQQVVNNMVTSLVAKYDEAMTIGDKDAASSYSGVIKQIAKDLDNLKEIKKEFAVTYEEALEVKICFLIGLIYKNLTFHSF